MSEEVVEKERMGEGRGEEDEDEDEEEGGRDEARSVQNKQRSS